MPQNLWTRFVRWFDDSDERVVEPTDEPADEPADEPKPAEPTLGEIHIALSEEFRSVRKMLRKQGGAVEELLRRQGQVPAPVAAGGGASGKGLLQLATAFFHLDQSLRDLVINSPAHREAITLFWVQLERELNERNVHIIREQGVAFDARQHRAVLSLETGAGEWVVAEVLEPGFLHGETVRTPAKVILRPKVADQHEQEDYA